MILRILVLAAASLAAADTGAYFSPAPREAIFPTGNEVIGPQLLVGGEWTTSVRIANHGASTTPNNRLNFVDHTGAPLTLTMLVNGTTTITASGVNFGLLSGGNIEIVFQGTSDTKYGHMYMTRMCAPESGCSVQAEVTVRNRHPSRPDFEAVFSFDRPAQTQQILWDHREGFSTLLYLVNDTAAASVATIELRDAVGNALLRTLTVSMAPGETQLLTLHALAPETIGHYGALTIRGAITNGPAASYIATALRINPSNSFTAVRSFSPQ